MGKHKIIQELLEIINNNKNKKIVFTNGYFDLIHSAHINLLKKAKQLGDILIVGINSDESVRQNKGPDRPILNERQRIEILEELQCIDYIVTFEELTPINLIQKIKPDILVKGGTYNPDEVIGKDIVETYGGKVYVLAKIEGLSSDEIIKTIKEKHNQVIKEKILRVI